MKVFNSDGTHKLTGKLNEKNMYVYMMPKLCTERTRALANAGEVLMRTGKSGGDVDTTDSDSEEDEAAPSLQLEAAYKNNIKVQKTAEHFTPRAKKRAIAALELHEATGHANDAVLGRALDAGCYAMTDLTSSDLRIARLLFGECNACADAKMTAPAEKSSMRWTDPGIGHTIYYDLVPLLVTTIGGNDQAMVGCDSSCGYMMVALQKGKDVKTCLKSVKKGIAEMNQHGHRVHRMVFDDEAVLKAMFDDLREMGIVPSTFPAGMKNKPVERKIRELKTKMRCMLAALNYVLPKTLRGELMVAAAMAMNAVPNSKTGPSMTPAQIITGRKVTPQPYKFGQVGLANAQRTDDPDLRAEYGIFLYSVHDIAAHMKVYVPSRRLVYSKRRFVKTIQYPAEWSFQKRLTDVREGNDGVRVEERRTPAIDMNVRSREMIQQRVTVAPIQGGEGNEKTDDELFMTAALKRLNAPDTLMEPPAADQGRATNVADEVEKADDYAEGTDAQDLGKAMTPNTDDNKTNYLIRQLESDRVWEAPTSPRVRTKVKRLG